MRYLRAIAVMSVMSLAVGCGGHTCKAFNDAVCNRAAQCGITGCQVQFDSCPGNEKADFSACIDATNGASCPNLADAVLNCKVVRG